MKSAVPAAKAFIPARLALLSACHTRCAKCYAKVLPHDALDFCRSRSLANTALQRKQTRSEP